MAQKVDSLTTVSNTRPLTLNTKSVNNNSIEVFTSDSIKTNVDEVNISNRNNNSQIAENTDNKRKWLIGLGISIGSIAIGVGAAVLLKKLPKGICTRWENPLRDYKISKPDSSMFLGEMHPMANGGNSSRRCFYNKMCSGRLNPEKLSEADEWIIQEMRCMDEAFSKLTPLEKDCIVYRGRRFEGFKSRDIDFSIIENAKVGDKIIPDTGYSYCGIMKELGECWASTEATNKSILYTIRLPKGAKVSRSYGTSGAWGGEVLMPRNAEYRVVSKTVKGNHTEVTLEYILPKKDNLQEINELMARYNLKPKTVDEVFD